MSTKKTFSAWLTTKYLLIIRNEENFAEKNTFKFNYAKLFALLLSFFTIILLASIFLVRVALKQWLDPHYDQLAFKQKYIDISLKLDTLQGIMDTRAMYFHNIRNILTGQYNEAEMDSLAHIQLDNSVILEETLQPIDSQFREKYEKTLISSEIGTEENTYNDINSMYFFKPIEGIISDAFHPKKEHFGIDIVGKENEPVKAIADGMVIFASWTIDGGHVIGIQHMSGLISIYKHNAEILKNVGNFVRGGEIVAIIGNSGELTSGTHLHLEIWYNGNPINPESYIGF